MNDSNEFDKLIIPHQSFENLFSFPGNLDPQFNYASSIIQFGLYSQKLGDNNQRGMFVPQRV